MTLVFPPSSCYSRSFCLPKSLRCLHNRSGSPLTHIFRYTDAAEKEEKRLGLGPSPEKKEALNLNSESTRSIEPYCPLIEPHLGGLGFYLTSCPGPEAFLLFTRTCFAPKSVHI